MKTNRLTKAWRWYLLGAFVLCVATVSGQNPAREDGTNLAADDQKAGERSGDLLGLGDGIDANLVRQPGDDFKSPQAAERFELRQAALSQRLAGKGGGRIHEVSKGQYVELGLERTDKIFVVLVEYGDGVGIATPPLSTAAGPGHDEIAPPDRSVDNSTAWQADYNREHYVDMYSNKMNAYYQAQSSGRYSCDGTVIDWVRVPFNGPRYGANAMGDAAAWTLIADAVNTWTAAQLASGKTLADVKAYLAQFDTWDRYDYDKDGNFNEPDGYIDHFQIVHAGEGEEAGGGALGADAIWSHRWFAWYNRRGSAGPAFNKYGGVEFGGGWGANPAGTTAGSSSAAVGPSSANVTNAHAVTPTGVFVGDYTIQPENGGLGIFAHEFGHDLGLPDHYDTAGGSNGQGYWNLMASGSWLGDGLDEIGNKPGDMSAWDKLQLGWLNYEIAQAGRFSTHRLGPAETNTKQAQGLVVVLPPETNLYYLYSPAATRYGAYSFWGGRDNLLDNTMTTPVAVPAGPPAYLYMRLIYDIESNWDYGYVAVSTDNGSTWTNLAGQYQTSSGGWSTFTTTSNPNGKNLGNGITGTITSWRYCRFNVSAYAGGTVLIRLRYKTDDYVNNKGMMADEITLGSFYDGAENGPDAWTMNGFKITDGTEPSNKPHYYIAEFRQYRDYDTALQVGPYNFGDAARPDWVYHYPYQDGLLITYWDSGESNDNTSSHPGEGRSLPIDAHPEPLIRTGTWPSGASFASPWSATVQTSDATFGLRPTDPLDIPFYGTSGGQRIQFSFTSPSLPAEPEFNDLASYWRAAIPYNSVIVPTTGTALRIINYSAQGSFMQVHVVPVDR